VHSTATRAGRSGARPVDWAANPTKGGRDAAQPSDSFRWKRCLGSRRAGICEVADSLANALHAVFFYNFTQFFLV